MTGQHANPKGAALTVADVLARVQADEQDQVAVERYGRHALDVERYGRHAAPVPSRRPRPQSPPRPRTAA